jgi:hypothetical protein
VAFSGPGQYSLDIICDDVPEPIARVYLDVR